MPFRPALIPTLALGVASFITMNLAAWQYGRHLDQEARLAQAEHRLTAPPATAANLSAPPEELEWRTASLTGRFEPETRAFVDGQTLFGEPGYRVIEVLRTVPGPRVLVDRGWVPAHDWAAHLESSPSAEPERVEGLLLPIPPGPLVTPTPADDTHPLRYPPEFETWMGMPIRRVGIPWTTLADRAGDVAPVYLVVGPERLRGTTPSRDTFPVSGYVATPKTIGHLSYAGQWSLITVVMVGVWAWAGILRGRRQSSPPFNAPPAHQGSPFPGGTPRA